MLARTHSAGVFGIEGFLVTVESDIGPGLSRLDVVGQCSGPLFDAGLRVRNALDACGVALPRCKQIVRVGPGERRNDRTGVDLAIACALLISHGVIPAESLASMLLWGELARDGSLCPSAGTLLAADTARRHGFRAVVVPRASIHETAPISGLEVLPMSDLRQLIAHVRGEL